MSQAWYVCAVLNGVGLLCPDHLSSSSSPTVPRKSVPEVLGIKIHKQILNKIVFSSTDWLKQHNSTISAKNFPFNEELRKVIYTVILCPCAFLEDIGSQLTSKQLVPLARILHYHLLIRALNKSQFSSTYKQESSTCFKRSIHAQMLIHHPYTECYQMCFCCLCSSYLKLVSKVY